MKKAVLGQIPQQLRVLQKWSELLLEGQWCNIVYLSGIFQDMQPLSSQVTNTIKKSLAFKTNALLILSKSYLMPDLKCSRLTDIPI